MRLPAVLLALPLAACVDATVRDAGTGGSEAVVEELPLPGPSGTSGGTGVETMPPSTPGQPPSSGASWVYASGRQLMVGRRRPDGSLEEPAPYTIKCVGWSPTGLGERNTAGYTQFYSQYAEQDVPLIAGLAANTVKTYSTFEASDAGLAILDRLYAAGLMVVLNVMPSKWDFDAQQYLKSIEKFRAHPAILMWQVGNELNYNKLYSTLSLDAAASMVAQAVDAIHAADPDHPVSVSWGNAPSPAEVARLSSVDIWSLNLYPHLEMTSRLTSWLSLSGKPMFVGEYGADAYNGKIPGEDQDSQATATLQLTQQIQAKLSARDSALPALGGCVFNLTDEWWKGKGSDTAHDTGGFDNSGVYPDGIANEEWWGLASVDRAPRKAYFALRDAYAAP